MASNASEDCKVLYDLMRRFWGGFGRQMERVLNNGGVNVPQYLAMVALSKSGEAMMGRLAADLHVTMGAATNIVDRLIRGGYVTRARGTDDRRVVRVKLQPKGVETLRGIEEEATAYMTSVLGQLDDARRKQFMETFARMVDTAEASTAAAVDASGSKKA